MKKNKGPTFEVFIPEHLADKIDAYDEIVKVCHLNGHEIVNRILKIIERVKK